MHIYNLKWLQMKGRAKDKLKPYISHYLFFMVSEQNFTYHLKKEMA